MIGKLSAWYRENVSESVECVSCRLISGFGMIGIGVFLLSQAKRRRSPVEHYAMKSIAAGAYDSVSEKKNYIKFSNSRWIFGRCTFG